MGLGDLISKVLVEMKADTSDLKSKIKELQGIEKERAQQQLKDAEATNKSHDGFIKTLGNVGLALGAVGKFADFARDAMKSYGDHLRLTTAAAGINIDALSKAFGGLASQHDLLTIAATTQNGALHLNQKEMETLGQASIALKNRGFDLQEAIKKLTDAAVKGKVEGLDDLGLSIKEGASKAETLKNLMGELNKIVADTGTSSSSAADDVQRFGVAWDNTTDSVKRFSAEAIMALAKPMDLLGEIEARRARVMAQINGTALSTDQVFGAFQHAAATAYKPGPTRAELQAKARADDAVIKFDEGFVYDRVGREKHFADLAKAYDEIAKKLLGVETAAQRAIRTNEQLRTGEQAQIEIVAELESAYAMQPQGLFNAQMQQLNELLDEGKISWEAYALARHKAFTAAGGKGEASSDLNRPGVDLNQTRADIEQAKEITRQALQDIAESTRAKAQGRTNSRQDAVFGAHVVFGEVQDWDPYLEMFGKLGDTFTAFGEAVGASYEAIVTGSGGAAKAFKHMLADGLMSLGKSSLVHALSELALGFGSLALGPLGGVSASMHFKSAAMHGAVAVAAGLAANSIGTSAQGAAADKAASEKQKEEDKQSKGSGGGGGSGGSGGSGKGHDTVIVAYLDPFANQPEHVRRQQAREMVTNVLGTGAVENS